MEKDLEGAGKNGREPENTEMKQRISADDLRCVTGGQVEQNGDNRKKYNRTVNTDPNKKEVGPQL